MKGTPWSDDELAALLEHYPAHGPAWSGWADRLQNRSTTSICNKAHALGLKIRPDVRGAINKASKGKHRAKFDTSAWTPSKDRLLWAAVILAVRATGRPVYEIGLRIIELEDARLERGSGPAADDMRGGDAQEKGSAG